MQYRALGSSGLRISSLVLGSDNFTNPTPATEAERIITMALDAGVNMIDTANSYAAGAAEELIGATVTVKELVSRFNKQVDKAMEQLKITDEKTLTEFRGVGRKMLPSTVIGLLVHGAEHTMRHLGQLMVTVKFLQHTESMPI